MRPLALLSTFAAAAFAAGVTFAAGPPAFRLPAGARPTHYALSLTVVPGEPRVSGEIAIDAGLCSENDAADVAAFWKARVKNYAAVERQLAATVDEIRVCAAVRGRTRDLGM